jgi:hypothetical protein
LKPAAPAIMMAGISKMPYGRIKIKVSEKEIKIS